jgi:hypothetical protein
VKYPPAAADEEADRGCSDPSGSRFALQYDQDSSQAANAG